MQTLSLQDLPVPKARKRDFLTSNPFPHPLTQGFFYREKMHAIHYIAPDKPFEDILEVGGGQSGLTALLYLGSQVTNIDLNPQYAQAPCNQQERVRFVCGNATALPFDNYSFDAVTMFDVLEHIPDHEKAVSEALRVLRPGGFLLISTPNENWRFPYYGFMKSICPSEAEVMAEWGHVRRGYTLDELKALIGLPCQRYATFINPLTVLCHDVAFSRLSHRRRQFLCTMLSPLTWLSYSLHKPQAIGTETASAWQKGLESGEMNR
jgi:SAM-dependent methyltransferase